MHPADGTIRVSERLRDVPGWVLDYVLVHELTHLLEPGHDERFWAWVHRYPAHASGRWATWKGCRPPPGSGWASTARTSTSEEPS